MPSRPRGSSPAGTDAGWPPSSSRAPESGPSRRCRPGPHARAGCRVADIARPQLKTHCCDRDLPVAEHDSQRGVPSCHPTTRPHRSRRAPDPSAVRRPPVPAAPGAAGATAGPDHGVPCRLRSSRRGPSGSGPSGRRPDDGGGSRGTAGKGTGSRPGKPRGKAPRSKKQRRNRRLKIAGALMAGMLVLLGVFVGVVYASTEVPSPDSITNAQTTVIYYSDGVTEMARLGDENRTNVSLDQISEPAQQRRARRREPGLLHRPGHLLHRHHPGGLEQRDRRLDAGWVDDHPAVREERDPAELRPDVRPEVPGAVPGDQAGQQLLEGPDPRELPEHHLLRPRRLRHRGGGQHLLRRPRRAADRRSRARCSPSSSGAPPATTRRSAPRTPRTAGARCSTRWSRRAG